MADETTIRKALSASANAGHLIYCRWPGSGELSICLEQHQIDSAVSAWKSMTDGDRARRMQSVRQAIKRVTKRVKQRRAEPAEMDNLAMDVALWLGHEMTFGDASEYLLAPPLGSQFVPH